MGEDISKLSKLSKNQGQLHKVIKQYREEGRHGETYTAQRQVPYKQNDDIMRIKRVPGGKPR